ncbi:MAG: DUF3276 family protein [Prevotella sp.]|nr:DUF3276 family protein [Prevotella sp.]
MKGMREDLEILQTSVVKAGSRRYYIDTKQTSNAQKYIVITESKKVKENGTYEINRIRLYPEDFDKFLISLHKTIRTIQNESNVSKS